MIVYGVDEEYDLSDVDSDVPDVLDIFRECNACLRALDQIISNHSVIYSCRNESEST